MWNDWMYKELGAFCCQLPFIEHKLLSMEFLCFVWCWYFQIINWMLLRLKSIITLVCIVSLWLYFIKYATINTTFQLDDFINIFSNHEGGIHIACIVLQQNYLEKMMFTNLSCTAKYSMCKITNKKKNGIYTMFDLHSKKCLLYKSNKC